MGDDILPEMPEFRSPEDQRSVPYMIGRCSSEGGALLTATVPIFLKAGLLEGFTKVYTIFISMQVIFLVHTKWLELFLSISFLSQLRFEFARLKFEPIRWYEVVTFTAAQPRRDI